MPDDMRKWADTLFSDAKADARVALNAKRGELMRTGAHRGSRSAFVLADVYLESIERALDKCLAGLANREDSRGHAWARAHSDIAAALKVAIEAGPATVHKYVSAELQTVRALVTRHLDDNSQRLIFKVEEHKQGWSAPKGKPWNERRPIIYAIILLIAGAVAGQVAEALADVLSGPGETAGLAKPTSAPIPDKRPALRP